MVKVWHEIRDPVHVFIRLDGQERKILDSRPFQRLRHIHQLAMTSLVSPGATHRRFEHSLGVMELATRIYDVITKRDRLRSLPGELKSSLQVLEEEDSLSYWRRVLRAAALCHDVGHLPFSHAAEKKLLPEGFVHERITRAIIESGEMRTIWEESTPPLNVNHIVKLALGPKKAGDLEFDDWETLLSEIIVGDTFGADRMDYLLRDSHHLGVAYGRFDHYRLIDTMRILKSPAPRDEEDQTVEPALGVEEGGVQAAEALLLARYFMYSQVYFHPVRRIYDIHLCDFLKDWREGGSFPVDPGEFLGITDNEVTSALSRASTNPGSKGHVHSKRIVERRHFKILYQRNPSDIAVNPEAGWWIFKAACDKFGDQVVRYDSYTQKGEPNLFPVLMRDGRVEPSLNVSSVLGQVPLVVVDSVYAGRDIIEEARPWLEKEREDIIATA